MHPSRVIRGTTSRLLEGRHILIGITGSIAAVEIPKIVRELLRHGAEVDAVMSGEATRILPAEAVEFATGRPAITRLTGAVEHVSLLGPGEGQVDLYLIAPATANTLSKIAHGIDDTPVTSCAAVALGAKVPMLVAPAMHAQMAENPALRESLARLERWGVGSISATSGEGEAKIAAPETVAAAVLHRLARGPWAGRGAVVIGGAGREPIDSVRSITNESSGASAVALATQAFYRGAAVELWAGAMQVAIPPWIPTYPWRSIEDLRALARRRRAVLRRAGAVLVPAALPDFTLDARPGKIDSRAAAGLSLELRPAPKLLPELRRLAPSPTRLVAFKLDAGLSPAELERKAERLRTETRADWVVANDARTMGSDRTEALVLPRPGERHWIRAPKPEFAGALLDELAGDLAALGGSPAGRPGSRPRPLRRTPARRG